MKLIDSTYEILAWKHLGQSVDERWSQWATDMVLAGFETEHLIELTCLEKPLNQFELAGLTDRVFEELQLDVTDREKILSNYVSYLGEQVLAGEREILSALQDIYEVWLLVGYEPKGYDFYCLYHAKADLEIAEVQWYWEGATRANIDQICEAYFRKWLQENPLKALL